MTTAHPATRQSTRPRVYLPRPAHPAPPVGPQRAVAATSRRDRGDAAAAPSRAWLVRHSLRVEQALVMLALLVLLAVTLVLLGMEWLDNAGSGGASARSSPATASLIAPLPTNPAEGGP